MTPITPTYTRHPAADILVAIADGKPIEFFDEASGEWVADDPDEALPALAHGVCADLFRVAQVKPQHIIGRAVPNSAYAMARATAFPDGCYYYTSRDDGVPEMSFATLADARLFADSVGTEPSRWSLDHPENAAYLIRSE